MKAETTKAILVINMPKSCDGCRLADFDRCWGRAYSHVHIKPYDIHVDCPLKPIPSRQYSYDSEMDIGYTLGWNYCIEELEK